MQAPDKPNSSDDSDKSHSDWPTLDDASNNSKKAVSAKKQIGDKCNKSPPKNQNGHDGSKEIDNPSAGPSGQGARKKNANKTKWVHVQIPHQPYKRRGNGRQYFDSKRINGDKQNESLENGNVYDGGKNFARGNSRFKGKRGRGNFHNFRQRRDESDPPANENDKLKFVNGYFSNPAFYDPFVYELYTPPAIKAEEDLKDAIRKQVEYYFSEGNLVNDTYLRRRMDSQGYAEISLIANFNRVRQKTRNLNRIVDALAESSKLELLGNTKVRPVIDPLKWPIKVPLRTDVPEFYPGQPYVPTLVNGIDNLSFNDVNCENLSQSPKDSLSPGQVGDFFGNPDANEIYYTSSSDTYSHTPSPPEHVNGLDYYSEPMSNDVYYCMPNVNAEQAISDGMSYFCGNSSLSSDNSVDDQHDILGNKSPEPTL